MGLTLLPLLPVMFDEPVEIGVEHLFRSVWPISREYTLNKHD